MKNTFRILVCRIVYTLVLTGCCFPAIAHSFTWVAGTLVAQTTTTATTPGGRFGTAHWIDADNNAWHFGGYGPLSGTEGYLGDLWKLNLNTFQWTHLNGSTTETQYGVYGTRGQESPTNMPGARVRAAFWADTSGSLWLYGGSGFGESEQGALNDLWRFNPQSGNWTWISGSKLPYQRPVHGGLRVPAPTNNPGGRDDMAFWRDTAGDFWLYGGQGYDGSSGSTGGFGYLSDLWRYNVTTGLWTWVNGSKFANYGGTYTGQYPSVHMHPGGRTGGTTWVDGAGNFWLFGGSGSLFNDSGWLNDLWRYEPQNNLWDLVKGASVANSPGSYGTIGVEASSNIPGARVGAAGWADGNGNLWLFSGYGKDFAGDFSDYHYSDIWKFDTVTGQWTWMLGSMQGNKTAVANEMGHASPDNFPGSRDTAATFVDSAGNFWLLGGSGYGTTEFGSLNDVWKMDLDQSTNASCEQWELY